MNLPFPLFSNEVKITYYQSLLELDQKTGEPKFYGKINEIDVKDFQYYFKKITTQKNRKKYIYYEYYEDQNLKGKFQFTFDPNKFNKWYLSRSVWFNNNGTINRIINYKYSAETQTVTLKKDIYNDFGVLIRKTTYVYNLNGFDPLLPSKPLEEESISDFTPKELILGKIDFN